MTWPPKEPNYTYEQVLEDVRQAATDTFDIAKDLGPDADLLLNSIFIELVIAKQPHPYP